MPVELGRGQNVGIWQDFDFVAAIVSQTHLVIKSIAINVSF